jgi:sugar O-acyltransferase (sialic acid O-acetyltransferase NeuD family)
MRRKKDRIILVGGGGHCLSCIDVILSENNYEIFGIIDLKENIGKKINIFSIIGDDSILPELRTLCNNALVTIGQIENNKKRKEIYFLLKSLNFTLPVIVAKSAVVSKNSTISEGTIVMHQALINSGTTIGKNVIINSKALIEHDVKIKDHVHVSTGALINGGCNIDSDVFIGSGSVLRNGINVCNDVIIGAASVVMKDITSPGTYFGNPLRRLR